MEYDVVPLLNDRVKSDEDEVTLAATTHETLIELLVPQVASVTAEVPATAAKFLRVIEAGETMFGSGTEWLLYR
jgi:hypothetical protein